MKGKGVPHVIPVATSGVGNILASPTTWKGTSPPPTPNPPIVYPSTLLRQHHTGMHQGSLRVSRDLFCFGRLKKGRGIVFVPRPARPGEVRTTSLVEKFKLSVHACCGRRRKKLIVEATVLGRDIASFMGRTIHGAYPREPSLPDRPGTPDPKTGPRLSRRTLGGVLARLVTPLGLSPTAFGVGQRCSRHPGLLPWEKEQRWPPQLN